MSAVRNMSKVARSVNGEPGRDDGVTTGEGYPRMIRTSTEDGRPIEILITTNTNLDGRNIASEVSRYVASGIDYRLTRI